MSTTAKDAQSKSAQTFVAALVVNASLLVVQVGAFVILKRKLGRIYSPRTFLPPPDKRADELPSGPWRWLRAVITSPTEVIALHNGLDAYMFLRFLKMLLWIFLVFTISTFPVLLPIDSVNVTNGQTGLNQFTWGNLSASNDQDRFAAHIILVYLLTFFVIFMIRREMLHFVHMRQQFLISKEHSRLAQARTVLITSVPDELANDHDMRLFASFVPGGVDRTWFFRDTKKLNKLFLSRQKFCKKLEAAETELLRKATKSWSSRQSKKVTTTDEEMQDIVNGRSVPPEASHEFLDKLVPDDQRPKHRTGLLGRLGPKVDTVEHCKDEISRLNLLIADARETVVTGKFLGSAFVRCNLQMGAHVLAQCVSHHQPLKMYDKWLEAHPKDIVWANLDENAVEARGRFVISWLATVGLIFAWVFPVAFVGTLSNITSLCSKLSWLNWICTAPAPIPGIVQGVLPPLLLAILFSLIPLAFRALAWYECIPRYSLISVSVYRRFFVFLLIHGFLVVTLTSGLTTAIVDILRTPASTIPALASRLPGASTFFLTYMVSQGLAGAGSALIQLGRLVFYFLRKWFLGRTPRQAFNVTHNMPSADFGVELPILSLLATIAFAYSIISPIINGLAFISYACIYLAWKFLILQVFDQPDELETGGLYFPISISCLFVGLYVEQACMACLFFLKISIARLSSIVEAVLMVVLLVITASAHIMIRGSFYPIINYLPMSLAMKKIEEQYERERLHQSRQGEEPEKNSDTSRVTRIRRRIVAIPRKIHGGIGSMIPFSEKHESTIAENMARSGGGADAEGPTDHSPDLFRHLSMPDCEKHDQFNRHTRPPGSVSRHLSGEIPDSSARSNQDTTTTSHQSHQSRSESSRSDRHRGDNDSEFSGDRADYDEHAFDHPSTYQEQQWIWIPKDTLGLSAVLVNDLKAVGVEASDDGASMDEHGNVEILGNPLDER